MTHMANIVRSLVAAGVKADELADIIEQIELYAEAQTAVDTGLEEAKRAYERARKAAYRAKKQEEDAWPNAEHGDGECPRNVPGTCPKLSHGDTDLAEAKKRKEAKEKNTPLKKTPKGVKKSPPVNTQIKAQSSGKPQPGGAELPLAGEPAMEQMESAEGQMRQGYAKVEPEQEASDTNTGHVKSGEKGRYKQTLLPDDWVLTEAHFEAGRAFGFSNTQIQLIGQKFSAYWREEQRRKADWFAVWQRWVANEKGAKPQHATSLTLPYEKNLASFAFSAVASGRDLASLQIGLSRIYPHKPRAELAKDLGQEIAKQQAARIGRMQRKPYAQGARE